MADAIIMLRGHVAEPYEKQFPQLVRSWWQCGRCGDIFPQETCIDIWCFECCDVGSNEHPFIFLGEIPIGDTPNTYQAPVLT